MIKNYILSVDQSTQGTKALLFDREGTLLCRADLPHEQIVNELGYVSHNLTEIYQNTEQVIKNVIEKAGICKSEIAGIGISSQRETSAAWNKTTGEPIAHAIVWQCARAKDICDQVERDGKAEFIRSRTGLNLSPYFPASKFAWFLQNIKGARELQERDELLFGTIDTWLIYCFTNGRSYQTDYSNASRTQLLNLTTLQWDEEICQIFGIKAENLAKVCDSNADFGETDLHGYFDEPVPIHGVLGDSHAALYGQGCLQRGMIKTTYGTGSSVMMNTGTKPIFSEHGVVTSLAWGMDGEVNYVLEGNINYTGAVITWLQKDLELIDNAKEAEEIAQKANPEDKTYLIPAFTGLGAPYWDSSARASISGISRMTGRAEIVKAGLECIAYQITDIVEIMRQDSGMEIPELRVDGGPTRNAYLMQFQSDLTGIPVQVPDAEELSGIGAAYAAGIALNIYDKHIFEKMQRTAYLPVMKQEIRSEKYQGWKAAVHRVLEHD